jgi:hypothetical protein
MYYHEVREALQVRPFEPLVFTFSDGSTEIVRHPEFALPGEGQIVIARTVPGRDAPWLKIYSLNHLVSIERESQRVAN